MTKRRNELIPQPRSRFLRIKCPKCGNIQVIFDRASFPARCFICGEVLTIPTGGKAKLNGETVKVLG